MPWNLSARQERRFPCVVWKGFPAFPAHLRMRPVSRGNSRRATWVGGPRPPASPVHSPTLLPPRCLRGGSTVPNHRPAGAFLPHQLSLKRAESEQRFPQGYQVTSEAWTQAMFRERGLPWLLWLLLLEQGRGIVGGRGHCPTPQGAGVLGGLVGVDQSPLVCTDMPGESQGLGNLVGCRPLGRTESDTTEVT